MTGRPEDDFRLINTEATLTLARAAERAKVKRFVFLSSIRAQSGPASEKVLTETNEPNPTDAYGRSKLAAEQGLGGIDLEWVALRLVLTYGPGVRGNIGRLVQLSRSRLPLPLKGLEARRSLLSLDNLVPQVLGDREAAKRVTDTIELVCSGYARATCTTSWPSGG